MTLQPTPGHICVEKHDPKGYIVPSVHCNTAYSSQDMEAASMSMDRGKVKKLMYIHTMEYYSVIKNNEIVPLQQHGWT